MPLRPFLFLFRPPAPRAFSECTRAVLEMPLFFASPVRREKKAHEQRARARSVKKREREKIDDDGLRLSRTKRHLFFFFLDPLTPLSLSLSSLSFLPPSKPFNSRAQPDLHLRQEGGLRGQQQQRGDDSCFGMDQDRRDLELLSGRNRSRQSDKLNDLPSLLSPAREHPPEEGLRPPRAQGESDLRSAPGRRRRSGEGFLKEEEMKKREREVFDRVFSSFAAAAFPLLFSGFFLSFVSFFVPSSTCVKYSSLFKKKHEKEKRLIYKQEREKKKKRFSLSTSSFFALAPERARTRALSLSFSPALAASTPEEEDAAPTKAARGAQQLHVLVQIGRNAKRKLTREIVQVWRHPQRQAHVFRKKALRRQLAGVETGGDAARGGEVAAVGHLAAGAEARALERRS